MDWVEVILAAFEQGKTIQVKNNNNEWHDFERQNQLDKPNINYDNQENWRIKPNYDAEREQLLKDCGRDDITPMMKENMTFSKEQLFLFAGFCIGRKNLNPKEDISKIFDDFLKIFK